MNNPNPNPTGYGWLVRLPSGELREFATEKEALEAVREEEEDEEA